LNGVMAVILRYSSEFGSSGVNHLKVVEVRPILSATKMSAKSLVLTIYHDIWRLTIQSSHQFARKSFLVVLLPSSGSLTTVISLVTTNKTGKNLA